MLGKKARPQGRTLFVERSLAQHRQTVRKTDGVPSCAAAERGARYAEKEARWKSTFQRLRSHLDVAPPVDVDAPAFVDGPEPADDTRG